MTSFQITREGTRISVMPGKRLTSVETPALQPALKQEIEAGGRELIFDMAGTESLDSTGIGLLIAAHNSLTPLQGGIRLINVSTDILKLLRTMRLADRLHATGEASHE